MRRFGLAVSMLWALGAHVLRAQQLVEPGARVRIVDRQGVRPVVVSSLMLTGSFVRMSGDSVFIVDRAGLLHAVYLNDGSHLQVSEGKRQHILEGLGIGLVLGAAVGAGVGVASYSEPKCTGEPMCLDFGPGLWALAYAVRFALPGLLIGGVIGSIPREQWREVWGTQATIARSGATQSVGIGFSLTF